MSEEKKNIELNDKELEKVNGGFGKGQPVTVIPYSFEAGDCFAEYSAAYSRRVRVMYSYKCVYTYQSIIAEVSDNNGEFHQLSIPLYDNIFREECYVGNNVF